MLFDFLFFATVFVFIGTIVNFSAIPLLGFETRFLKLFTIALMFRMLLCWFYYYYFLDKSADAQRYYSYAISTGFSVSDLFVPGTDFIKNISALFYQFTPKYGSEYLMLFLPFGICGHIGSLLFFAICRSFELISERIRFAIPFFLPNLVFWTSNLGKDSLVYMGLMLALFAFLVYPGIVGRVIMMITGLWLVFSIRPHVAGVLLLAIMFGLFSRMTKIDIKTIVLAIVASLSFYLLYDRVLEYVGLDIEIEQGEDAVGSAAEIYEQSLNNMQNRANSLNYGGAKTGNRVVSLAYAPVYFFGFIGAPFIWQSRKPMQFVAALESLIYTFALFYIIRYWSFFRRHKGVEFKYFLVLYILLASTILGMSYTNFGLTIRQKCMVIPALMIMYLIVASERKLDEENKALVESE